MCGRLGAGSMRVMLFITRPVWLRGPVATVVASWLAAAVVSLTHDPLAAPAHQRDRRRKKTQRRLEAL
jgi:hypothetical protein